MDILKNILSQEIIQNLGWTLLHFIWQAAAIGLLLAIVLRLLHKSSANLRYIIACMALALIVLMPIVTIRMVDVPVETIEPVKLVSADLSKAGVETQGVVEMPQMQSPPAQAAVTPPVPLKDRFIEAVEPALPFIVVGWLLGVFCLSIWHLGGWAQLQRLRRKMVKQVAERVNQRLKHLAEKLGIKRTVEIAESALVQVPAVVGWLRPVILLPATALTGLTAWQLEAILAHELAHIKRCDYLVNMLQTAVEILGFYHPAVWWVSHKIRAERENCCDDLAVAVSGDRVAYARALTSMEQVRTGYTLAVAADGGGLFQRIRRLLAKDHANQTKISWLPSAIAIMLIASLLIPVSFAMSGRLKTESETTAQKELSEFKKTLSNGVTVELVGLGTAPWKTEQQWWKPDGTNLNQPTLKYPHLFQWPDQPNGWRFTCTALCKFSNYTGKEISVPEVKFSNEEMLTRVWGTNFTTDGYKMTYIAYNPSIGTVPDKTDMRLAVGSEEFVQAKRLGKYTPKQHQIHWLEKNSDLIILHPVRIGQVGTPCVDLTCKQENKEIEFRVFAKLKNGETEPWHGGGIGKDVLFFQSTPKRQNTKIEDIEDIIIEFRPYEWVEFKNVSLKPNFKTDVQIEIGKHGMQVEKKKNESTARLQDEELRQRSESLKKLRSLGLLLIMYADDHDERYPYGLELIKRYDDKDEVVSWALENVGYLGRGRSAAVEPQALIAYDKTMLLEKGCTNLLFNDSHVEFCEKKRVKDTKSQGSSLLDFENRWNSAQNLSDLGKAMLIFACNHDDRYPQSLDELSKADWFGKTELDWLKENIEYLGHREKPTSRPATVLAYDKTLLEKGESTNVLYNDCRVKFEKPETLKKLGIKTESFAGRIKKFKRQLEEPVTVHIAHSPENDRLSVQFAVMAICKAAGVPYNWDKSAELAEPQRRQYIEPVNIQDKIASQAIADMLGSVGLLYGVDTKGVYLYRPEKTAATQSHLQILNIELEPVAQGKNIIYATVENSFSKEQLFAIHIYTRSVDYGPHGVGWGTRFFEKIRPNETKRTRFAYKIQGPVTENTYIRVKFYNPATKEQYNYDKPFAVHLYKGSDLKRRSEKKTVSKSKEDFTEIIIGSFTKVQRFIKDKKYEQAWELFSQDYQRSEYQVRGFERFQKAMEPKHPMDSAFTWEKSQFLKLKPKQLEINDSVTLSATYKKETWKITFIKEDNQWKIDDIVGYRPRILDIQEEDNK